MPIDVDGLAVLRAMTEDPETFSGIRAEAAKVAKSLLLKQFKAKGLTLEGLRRVYARLPEGTLSILFDDMPDKDLKALVTKLDGHNAAVLAGSPIEQGAHVHALLEGKVSPTARAAAPKVAKPEKALKPKLERAGNSKAMTARRKAA